MPAPRSSAARLRFAASSRYLLELPREEGLDLLDWLGLGRPEFGAIAARELAPRCRRRLWTVVSSDGCTRDDDPSRRARTRELLAFLALAEGAGETMVMFG